MSNSAERMPSGPPGPAHTWRPGYACLRKGHAVWALWPSHTRAHTHAQVMNARSLRLSVCGGVLNKLGSPSSSGPLRKALSLSLSHTHLHMLPHIPATLGMSCAGEAPRLVPAW